MCILKLKTTRLHKCLKSPVSEYPFTVNILKGPKHCLNMHDGCFIMFFHCSKRSSVGETPLVISEILGLFVNILNLLNLQHFEKRITLIVYVFSNL